MREIKFRGKTKEGKWIYGFPLGELNFIYPEGIINTNLPELYEIIPKTLGQYTGLKDKNGKEIYEGDIIKMKITYAEYAGQDEDEMKVWYEIGKVEFSSGSFWIYTKGHSINCHFHYNDSDREVIGNIYENPELLK